MSLRKPHFAIVAVLALLMAAMWPTAARADYLSAVAHDSGGTDFFTCGSAVTFGVGSGGSYEGLATQVTALDSGQSDFLGTRAILLGGTNSGAATTVSMAWRNRTDLEVNSRIMNGVTWIYYPESDAYQCAMEGLGSNGRGAALAYDTCGMGNDILNLQGVNGAFVLQMDYSESALIYDYPWWTEEFLDSYNSFYVGWFETNGTGRLANYDEWVNAVDGNSTTGSKAESWYKGTFSDFTAAHPDFNLTDYLGSFGSDIESNTVWAVLDHNSQFGAVPEPGTLALVSLGLLALARRRR